MRQRKNLGSESDKDEDREKNRLKKVKKNTETAKISNYFETHIKK